MHDIPYKCFCMLESIYKDIYIIQQGGWVVKKTIQVQVYRNNESHSEWLLVPWFPQM
jgi:hypothetical protein